MPNKPTRSRAYCRLIRERRYWKRQAKIRATALRNQEQAIEASSDSDGDVDADGPIDDDMESENETQPLPVHDQGHESCQRPQPPVTRDSSDDATFRNRPPTNVTPMLQPGRATAEENIRHVVEQHVEQGRDGKCMGSGDRSQLVNVQIISGIFARQVSVDLTARDAPTGDIANQVPVNVVVPLASVRGTSSIDDLAEALAQVRLDLTIHVNCLCKKK